MRLGVGILWMANGSHSGRRCVPVLWYPHKYPNKHNELNKKRNLHGV
jgi:hypothetical protein